MVDDDEAIGRLFRDWVEADGRFRVTGVFANASDALREIPRLNPMLAAAEVRLPDLSGVECARRLKGPLPDLKVLLMTGFPDADALRESMGAGAAAFLIKPFDMAQAVAALRIAMQGTGIYLSKQAGALFGPGGGATESTFPASAVPHLTQREREVLDLAARGLQDKQIADRLGIALGTVHTHLDRIYRDWRVPNRAAAAVRYAQGAWRRGASGSPGGGPLGPRRPGSA